MADIMTGIIIRLLPNKGYGFLRGEDGESRFFHATKVEPPRAFDRMREGQSVTFVSVDHANGMRAECVKPCDPSTNS